MARTGTPVENLVPQIAEHIRGMASTGLFMVSMDHSPTEQLTGAGWHTTVLILSPAMQHHALAKSIAHKLRPLSGELRKWNRTNRIRGYREEFLGTFFQALKEAPEVQVYALSAQEDEIRASTAHFVEQLWLSAIYKPFVTPEGRRRVSIGPLTDRRTGISSTFELAENRATMCLFIGHFVARVRQAMASALEDVNRVPSALNWTFLADKFPGPPDRDMEMLFRITLAARKGTDRVLWGYAEESDRLITDLLADNLAGALTAGLTSSNLVVSKATPGSALFAWEIWSPNDHSEVEIVETSPAL